MSAAEQVLRDRARLLARPVAPDADPDVLALVTFEVGDDCFGIEVAHVREVLPRAEVSHLPWAAPGVIGVTNLRSEIVTVADLARLLGVGKTQPAGPVVVVDLESSCFGLRVDALGDLLTVPRTDLQEPTGHAAQVAGPHVLGYASGAVVLDVRTLLPHPPRTDPSQEGT